MESLDFDLIINVCERFTSCLVVNRIKNVLLQKTICIEMQDDYLGACSKNVSSLFMIFLKG